MDSKDGDAIKDIEVTEVQKLDKDTRKAREREKQAAAQSPISSKFLPHFLPDFPPEDQPFSGSLQSTEVYKLEQDENDGGRWSVLLAVWKVTWVGLMALQDNEVTKQIHRRWPAYGHVIIVITFIFILLFDKREPNYLNFN